MTATLPDIGKIFPEIFQHLILPHLDARDARVLVAISEGTLLLTCRPEKADAVVRALAAKGIVGSVGGEMLPAERGMTVTEGGTDRPLVHPRVDPFWNAFGQAMAQAAAQ